MFGLVTLLNIIKR